MNRSNQAVLAGTFLGMVCCSSCRKAESGADAQVSSLGSAEITAQLVEIRGTFPPNNLYDYVYVLKYRVLETHRGKVDADTILVGQYNPLKPRAQAADARSVEIGGNVRKFAAGDVHRMALDVPLDDHYMGPIINKYHDESSAAPPPLYWAIWTNRVVR